MCPTDLRATCVHGWVLAITCDQASRKWSQVPRTFLYAPKFPFLHPQQCESAYVRGSAALVAVQPLLASHASSCSADIYSGISGPGKLLMGGVRKLDYLRRVWLISVQNLAI
jgi:hypothetical protein